MQKNSITIKKITINKLQTLRKHKLVKPLKSLTIIWILCFFILIIFYTYSYKEYTELVKKIGWATFKNHWDLLLLDCA